MQRKQIPAAVYKLTFEEKGQDFSTWYVRARIVIDSEPGRATPYVGAHINRMPEVPGSISVMLRNARAYLPLDCQVIEVVQLSEEQAAEVLARWREIRREIING